MPTSELAVAEAPAHDAPRLWFEADTKRTYAGLGRLLGVGGPTVAGWCRALDPTRPKRLALLLALELVTGIPPHAWLTDSERAWLTELSGGSFTAVFERRRRPVEVDPRQLTIDSWIVGTTSPPAIPFDPDAESA